MTEKYNIPEENSLDSMEGVKSNISFESVDEYVEDFELLRSLGSNEFGKGQNVSFQPIGRYERKRQKGTVRLWTEDPNTITINFTGGTREVPYPDSERIILDDFDNTKNILKIKKEK